MMFWQERTVFLFIWYSFKLFLMKVILIHIHWCTLLKTYLNRSPYYQTCCLILDLAICSGCNSQKNCEKGEGRRNGFHMLHQEKFRVLWIIYIHPLIANAPMPLQLYDHETCRVIKISFLFRNSYIKLAWMYYFLFL